MVLVANLVYAVFCSDFYLYSLNDFICMRLFTINICCAIIILAGLGLARDVGITCKLYFQCIQFKPKGKRMIIIYLIFSLVIINHHTKLGSLNNVQADVCHAYQVLKKGGMKDENIVVFMYDDIAHNRINPRQGVIINHPSGTDVYNGVPKVLFILCFYFSVSFLFLPLSFQPFVWIDCRGLACRVKLLIRGSHDISVISGLHWQECDCKQFVCGAFGR